MCTAGSASSQVSTEMRTRRRLSRHEGEGDGLKTSLLTTSSVSILHQFVTSVRSAMYFCLITCPAGMF